jgi:hypothetical protein
MAQSIKCNGSNNDDDRNDFLNPVSEIQFGAAICHYSHDKRADGRIQNPPSPPLRLAPPMITAAITASSRPFAVVGSPTVR